MASHTLYNQQLRLLEKSLEKTPNKIHGTRRSVVACIVRKPLNKKKNAPLEMFFILRASDPNGARWSGQVGFPGGHVEDGETDRDAVCRECEEEVNFHLKKSARYIGETRPRIVQKSNVNETLVVCCHIYEMLNTEIPVGQAKEVAACGWTPLTVLTTDEYVGPLNWSSFNVSKECNNANNTMSNIWDHFPSVQLIFPNHHENNLFIVDKNKLNAEQAKERFKLWGLTLYVVNDIMIDSGLRDTPIDSYKPSPTTCREFSRL